MVVTSINDNNRFWRRQNKFDEKPTVVLMDDANKRFYVGDKAGNIYVYRQKVTTSPTYLTTHQMPIKLLHILQIKQETICRKT